MIIITCLSIISRYNEVITSHFGSFFLPKLLIGFVLFVIIFDLLFVLYLIYWAIDYNIVSPFLWRKHERRFLKKMSEREKEIKDLGL